MAAAPPEKPLSNKTKTSFYVDLYKRMASQHLQFAGVLWSAPEAKEAGSLGRQLRPPEHYMTGFRSGSTLGGPGGPGVLFSLSMPWPQILFYRPVLSDTSTALYGSTYTVLGIYSQIEG
ncbi:hypothetical protein FRB95_007274 [Tulasnella sp. JGI-2019a]|nr:hypothetical protein FRB95_007274 [Tulasnella sp. JGI-2019a]